ncbi:mediator complex subunit Med5-domain-containing protein [Myxozyma melibiosi]|uniref:Mediator of RNA polymerase II transcription subunit 5 n=1 Tax=Myxozyma melibiosi TaxID=54550 RepID=A0ABR1F7J7_9ASCO
MTTTDADRVTVAKLIGLCLRRRVPPDDFVVLLRELVAQNSTEDSSICHDLLQPPLTTFTDPLLVRYIVSASTANPPLISLSSLLLSLEVSANPETLTDVLGSLASAVSSNTWTPSRAGVVSDLVSVLSRLLTQLASNNSVYLSMNNGDQSAVELIRDVTAEFTIALSSNSEFAKMFNAAANKDQQNEFQTALEMFINHLHITNQPLAEKLSAAISSNLNITSSLPTPTAPALVTQEVPAARTKGQVEKLEWVESLLSGPRPQFGSADFATRLTALFTTESGDVAISSLTSSSLDALSHCALSQESNSSTYRESSRVKLWKAFIINRLPLIFKNHLSELPSATFEYALRKPLLSIDESTLALLNRQDENEIDMMFSTATPYDIRREFLKSMVKCGLIEPNAIDRVVGGGPANENDGMGQDMTGEETSAEKLPGSVELIMEMVNNSYDSEGAIKMVVGQVVEADCLTQHLAIDAIISLLESWIEQRETYRLRILAQEVAHDTQVMNLMLVYRDPYEILKPLITCLDTWLYEDETNFQDNYTDFGVILLFICAFYYHFKLDIRELGELGEHSFVRKYLTSSGAAQPAEMLNEENLDLLGGWITALFDTNGISDELMKSCTPMAYSLLVPTIFYQAVTACNRNFLDMDTLKGGLEYFFQPFLLASIVGALHWLSHHLWTLRDISVPLQILQALVMPPSLPDEAVPIHKLVLRIGSAPVYHNIQEIMSKGNSGGVVLPDSVDLVGVIKVLTPHLDFRKEL